VLSEFWAIAGLLQAEHRRVPSGAIEKPTST
jgi:hypothetical protein